MLPLVKVKNKYSIEEAQDLVIKALKPMGKEYLDEVKRAFNERWVDYYPIDNKMSGAYSIGSSYNIDKKYILMNYDDTLRSVETLAHEMGHSMHSYYSDNNQKINASGYPIFLAEIASIFNELMLTDYLLKNVKNDNAKFEILTTSIDGFIGTVMRQTE
jgi:oligoendopeptidase F